MMSKYDEDLAAFMAERGGSNRATSFLRVQAVPALDGQRDCHDIVLRLDGTYGGQPGEPGVMGTSDDMVTYTAERLADALAGSGVATTLGAVMADGRYLEYRVSAEPAMTAPASHSTHQEVVE